MAEKAFLPLFPLDLVLLPGERLPLHIFEPRYRRMITAAHAERTEFGVIRQNRSAIERCGCAARVSEITRRFADGQFDIRAVGTRRFQVSALDTSEDCLQAVIEFFGDNSPAQANAAKVEALLGVARRVLRLLGGGRKNWEPNHPWLSFLVASDLSVSKSAKQKLLETRGEIERVEILTAYLEAVIAKRERRRGHEILVRGNGRLRG